LPATIEPVITLKANIIISLHDNEITIVTFYSILSHDVVNILSINNTVYFKREATVIRIFQNADFYEAKKKAEPFLTLPPIRFVATFKNYNG
jgi:hypothetical protein